MNLKNTAIDTGLQAAELRNICRKKSAELKQRCRAPKYYQDQTDNRISVIYRTKRYYLEKLDNLNNHSFIQLEFLCGERINNVVWILIKKGINCRKKSRW